MKRSTPSGKYLAMGRGEAAFRAFVPAPLPPGVALDAGLVLTLSDADRALGELAGLSRMLPNPNLLIRPFIRREAVLSSRIEGTEADLADLYGYEAGRLGRRTRKPPAGDVREVLNYVEALEYGLKRLESLPVSLRLIKEIHGRLMEGVRGGKATPGEFRRSQNWIGPAGCSLREASYVPPPVPEMEQALDAFEKYLHAPPDLPPLVRLALIHYQFEAIHPFLDGNGRVGRLLSSLLLAAWGLLPQPLLYLSAYFERRREDYYGLLRAVGEGGAWREWIAFFLSGVAEQARDAVACARSLQELQGKWRDALMRRRSSALLIRLADSLFENPVLTIPGAQRVLGVKTYHSARRCIDRLVEIGALGQGGDGPQGKTYSATDILKIVEERTP